MKCVHVHFTLEISKPHFYLSRVTGSVFEIKGVPCTRCAQFRGLVHRFWNLCTRQMHAFPNILYIYIEMIS